jgi:cytochrome c biogenesis protein CcdA
MRRRFVLIGFGLALALLLSPLLLAETPTRLTVYFSPTCESCHYVREQILPPLQETYGSALEITFIDMTTPAGLAALEAEEARIGRANNPLPVIVSGDTIIADENPLAVQRALAAFLEEQTAGAAPMSTVLPQQLCTLIPKTATPLTGSSAAIHLAYVEKDGCEHCARARVVLDALQAEFPALAVTTLNSMRDADLIEAMGQALELPESRRLIAPSVYVGRDALVNDEITSGALRALLQRYAPSGAPAFWQDLDSGDGRSSIVRRFQSMGPLAVVLAALIDGINPCAFATILFFVSYLAVSRRGRGALIAIGLAFTAGVFVTYTLVGLGAMSLLRWAHATRLVGTIIYGVLGLGCLVLAGFSVHDYVLARQGKLHEMKLNLPEKLRERIKGRIRAGSGAFAGAAFVSGLVVSLLELACTGQVYLPTISFVVSIPSMRASGVAYLLLYNAVFVVPLLVVLFMAVYGVSASRFQDWFVRHAATAKLVMAILFVVLGLLLLSQLFSA